MGPVMQARRGGELSPWGQPCRPGGEGSYPHGDSHAGQEGRGVIPMGPAMQSRRGSELSPSCRPGGDGSCPHGASHAGQEGGEGGVVPMHGGSLKRSRRIEGSGTSRSDSLPYGHPSWGGDRSGHGATPLCRYGQGSRVTPPSEDGDGACMPY